MDNKICFYRNCDNQLINMRKDAKFCCRECKQMERIYLKRKEKSLQKKIDDQRKLVEAIKLIKEEVNKHTNI